MPKEHRNICLVTTVYSFFFYLLIKGYDENDIYVTSHTDMAGDTDYYYTICCPVCGKETDISEKDIPYSIRRKKLEEHKGIYQRVYERER